MKPDGDLGWAIIQQDPLLRTELMGIEQDYSTAEDTVEALIAFFTRIEGVARLVLVLSDEETETGEVF